MVLVLTFPTHRMERVFKLLTLNVHGERTELIAQFRLILKMKMDRYGIFHILCNRCQLHLNLLFASLQTI